MSFCRDSALVAKLEGIIMPLIDSTLDTVGSEITDECIECAIMLLFHGHERVSLPMQQLFGKFVRFVLDDEETDFGFGYIPQIFSFIQAFFQKDPFTFLAQGGPRPTYLAQTFSFIEAVFERAQQMGAQSDLIVIQKFIISVLLTLKDRVNEVLPSILKLQFVKAPVEDEDAVGGLKLFENMKIQVFGACLEYNSPLTLQVLEHLGQVPTVLTLILTESLNMKHHFELKRVVLGFSSLLTFAA